MKILLVGYEKALVFIFQGGEVPLKFLNEGKLMGMRLLKLLELEMIVDDFSFHLMIEDSQLILAVIKPAFGLESVFGSDDGG